jgi:hypothetical protein
MGNHVSAIFAQTDKDRLVRRIAAVTGVRSPDGCWSLHAQLPTVCHPLP